MKSLDQQLVRQLVRKRQRLGLTQQQLAVRAGYSLSAISRYERGSVAPRLCILTDAAEALGMELRIVEKGN